MSAAPQVKDQLKFDIEVTKGPHSGLKMSFTKGSVTIGRGPENDIVLANDPRTSRQHAEIKQRGNDFVVVNLSQKNFILVNGSNVQTELVTNDTVIMVGDSEIRLRAETPNLEPVMPVQTAHAVQTPNIVKKDILQPQPRLQPQAVPSAGVSPTIPPPMGAAYNNSYQVPPIGESQSAVKNSRVQSGGLLENPKVRFYGIVAVVGLVMWFLLSPSKKAEQKDPNAFRTSEIAMADVRAAEKNTQELLSARKEKYDTVQYRRAQENFVRGFRDYQQGQYARAREAFQVVLNLDPENELAKRYYHLSKLKFDEMVKFNMIQGNRYREKKNWRMCQSSYAAVMAMLQNRRDDPTFKEAKQLQEECKLNLEGRF